MLGLLSVSLQLYLIREVALLAINGNATVHGNTFVVHYDVYLLLVKKYLFVCIVLLHFEVFVI